jgi:hypothetical protein
MILLYSENLTAGRKKDQSCFLFESDDSCIENDIVEMSPEFLTLWRSIRREDDALSADELSMPEGRSRNKGATCDLE